MARNRLKTKGRADRGSFAAIPHEILNHPNFTGLSSHGVKLLIDLYSQYRGKNNGDFSATWSRMKSRGWHSKGTLNRALKELLCKGWIIISRQGWRNHCSLYAVTFQPIDECGDKLDEPATLTSLGYWKTGLQN